MGGMFYDFLESFCKFLFTVALISILLLNGLFLITIWDIAYIHMIILDIIYMVAMIVVYLSIMLS